MSKWLMFLLSDDWGEITACHLHCHCSSESMDGKCSETFWFRTVVRCVRCCPLDIREKWDPLFWRSELWMTGIKLLVIPNGTQLPFQFLALCTVCQFSSRSRGWAGMDQRIFMITCHAAPCHLRSTRWQRAQEKATVKLSVYFPC